MSELSNNWIRRQVLEVIKGHCEGSNCDADSMLKSVDLILYICDTRPDLKAELVEAIEAKKCGKKLSLVDYGLDEAIEVVNTIMGESE